MKCTARSLLHLRRKERVRTPCQDTPYALTSAANFEGADYRVIALLTLICKYVHTASHTSVTKLATLTISFRLVLPGCNLCPLPSPSPFILQEPHINFLPTSKYIISYERVVFYSLFFRSLALVAKILKDAEIDIVLPQAHLVSRCEHILQDHSVFVSTTS